MYQFNDGSYATINPDKLQVEVFNDPDGSNFVVSGFASAKNAQSFIIFGDLTTANRGNDYISITGSKEDLKWCPK